MTATVSLGNGRKISVHLPRRDQVKRLWLWAELLALGALVQLGLWIKGTTRANVVITGVVWIVLTTLIDRPSKKEMGLVWKNSRETLWLFEWATATVALIWLLSTSARYHPPGIFLGHKAGYLVWAFMQQFIMQSYVFVRMEKLFAKNAPKYTAVCFTLAHLPNPALMVIALAGGWVTSIVFSRYRNLWTLAVCHGLIGAAIAEFWPIWIMTVGIGFYEGLL